MIYSFNIFKTNQIFNHLIANKVIKLLEEHIISLVEELKKKSYYKWHKN